MNSRPNIAHLTKRGDWPNTAMSVCPLSCPRSIDHRTALKPLQTKHKTQFPFHAAIPISYCNPPFFPFQNPARAESQNST